MDSCYRPSPELMKDFLAFLERVFRKVQAGRWEYTPMAPSVDSKAILGAVNASRASRKSSRRAYVTEEPPKSRTCKLSPLAPGSDLSEIFDTFGSLCKASQRAREYILFKRLKREAQNRSAPLDSVNYAGAVPCSIR